MLHLQDFTRSFLLLVASLGLPCAVGAAEPLEAFLAKHCVSCHGPDNEEGDLRINQLSRDFKSGGEAHLWAEVIRRINSGEMPPPR